MDEADNPVRFILRPAHGPNPGLRIFDIKKGLYLADDNLKGLDIEEITDPLAKMNRNEKEAFKKG